MNAFPVRKAPVASPDLTYRKIAKALSEHSGEILAALPTTEVQLSVPADGGGLRIRASVKPAFVDKLPPHVSVRSGRGEIDIPIEACGDYALIKAL